VRVPIIAWLLPALLASASPADAAKRAKFYFEVRAVQVPGGSAADLKERARGLLLAELKKQPLVVMELGDPRPRGADLEKALKARKLAGYELVLRVVKSKHSLQPPPAGKVYKMLMVEVEVAIDAQKIPSGQMALAGDGTAQVGTEVSAVKEKEKQELLTEALGEAIKQAVAKSVSRLGAFQAGKPPRRKKK
jgi:hypothetical protein